MLIAMTPAELAQNVRLLEITTRHTVTEVFAGEYTSAFKGRGMEFADVREYQPGDDVRTIDWNVTARTGRTFVKRFTEERELTVLLVVDLSASGEFGTQRKSKRELISEVAGTLAYAAARQGDRVGLLVVTDHVEMFVPPRKGPKHALRLIRDLLAFEPKHVGTDLSVAATHIARLIHRRSVVFVVSDFLMAAPAKALSTIVHRHDVVALQVEDPRDRALVAAGILDVRDPETGAIRTIDTSSARVRLAYAASWARRQQDIETSIRGMGIDSAVLTTERPFVHDLVQLFRRREARR